ncbi:MAG: fibronectin type III domain-containing protein [Verrucomicrobiaceae bacterium]|nr:fibronectin type III domain-containing protein [Verrucomicrobiaceae bacterium]
MASNRLPDKLDRLFSLAEDMSDGLHVHETSKGVKQNTESVVRPALAAARAAESAYGDAKVEKKDANTAVTNADKAAKVFITNARKRLSKFFGETASAEWEAAGWPPGSIAMPTEQDLRFNLLASLQAHFTSHPAHESTDMEVTAALAEAAHAAYSGARNTLAEKIMLSGQKKAVRDTAVANLRKRMEGLISELATLLTPDDPLWHAFGLNRPADEETPEAPSFTTAVHGPDSSALVDWDDALRADRWRVWRLIVGVDTEFQAVLTVTESDATLPGLPAGATVKIRVTSVNDAGESQPGPEAQIVMP